MHNGSIRAAWRQQIGPLNAIVCDIWTDATSRMTFRPDDVIPVMYLMLREWPQVLSTACEQKEAIGWSHHHCMYVYDTKCQVLSQSGILIIAISIDYRPCVSERHGPNALPCLFALHITEKHAKGQHTAINLAGASVPKLVPDYYQFLSGSVVVVRFSLISTIYIIHVEGVRCNYGTMPPNCKQIKQWEIFLVIISLFRCCCCCSCCVPMQSVSCQCFVEKCESNSSRFASLCMCMS